MPVLVLDPLIQQEATFVPPAVGSLNHPREPRPMHGRFNRQFFGSVMKFLSVPMQPAIAIPDELTKVNA